MALVRALDNSPALQRWDYAIIAYAKSPYGTKGRSIMFF